MSDTPIGTARRVWTHRDNVPVATLIDSAWDQIAELEDAGSLSGAQFAGLMRRADEMPATPVGQYLVLALLRRAIADPTQVGVNLDTMTFPCRCGEGRGMVLVDAATNTWRPCGHCNPGAYRLWAECYLVGCRGCDRCRPGSRRRGMQGDHRAEAAEHQREQREQRVKDDLR